MYKDPKGSFCYAIVIESQRDKTINLSIREEAVSLLIIFRCQLRPHQAVASYHLLSRANNKKA